MHNFHLAKDRITRDEKAEELQRIRSEQEASLSRRHPEESPFHREKSDKRAIRYAGGGSGLGVIGTGNNESNTSSTGNTVKSLGKSPNKKNLRMKEQTSVASSVSEKKHPSSPTNRPQFLVGTMSPQDSQKFATEIEGRVLKKISNTVFGDGESDVGMNYPVKLPEARYQLIELHGILDEMINETRYHQQVLLGSNTTFEATARLCLFDKATNMPTTVAPLGILSSTGSQHGGTTSMPAIESKSSGGKLSGGIPATITINKNISIGHSGGSGGGVSANSSSSVKSPVPPSSGSVGGGSIGSVGSGSHARDAYTNRFEGSSSRIDSINQSVKNNTVRQIYSNINSNGTSSIRPLDSSVSGLEQKAQKFSYDIILAQLTNQAVVKASRLHKYYRKHLIAVEREYHNEMESMRKTTEVVKTRLHIYETKELASQRRVQALLKGAVKHDEHHFESDIVLPEITEYLAKNSSDPETASATGGIDHKGLTGGVGGDIAEMLAHQLTEERHNNSKYIEELTEEVEALQKKFNVAVQANRRMQEELEDKDLEVDDLKDRMNRQRTLWETERDELKKTIETYSKQKAAYETSMSGKKQGKGSGGRNEGSRYDDVDGDWGGESARGNGNLSREQSTRGGMDRRSSSRGNGSGVGERKASVSPMISRQGSVTGAGGDEEENESPSRSSSKRDRRASKR